MILRTIISANQLSIYGALAGLCKELTKDSEVQGNLQRMRIWNQWKYLQDFLLLIFTPTREMKNLCPEYTLPRHEKTSGASGWIIGITKIGPVLDVKVCLHQERYRTEILIESLFRDGTASWVRTESTIM